MTEPTRRRRRRRTTAGEAAEPPTAEQKPRRPRGDSTGLRNIVGAGPSQLGVSGALRGRDVNRPDPDDLAEAERDVVIVRRHWKPPSS